MEITDEQIKELKVIIGEKRLIKIIPNMPELYNENKIYAFIGISHTYKLHRIEYIDGVTICAWISLRDSTCLANGTGTANEMISYASKKLKVFNNYREFIEWNYNNLTKK